MLLRRGGLATCWYERRTCSCKGGAWPRAGTKGGGRAYKKSIGGERPSQHRFSFRPCYLPFPDYSPEVPAILVVIVQRMAYPSSSSGSARRTTTGLPLIECPRCNSKIFESMSKTARTSGRFFFSCTKNNEALGPNRCTFWAWEEEYQTELHIMRTIMPSQVQAMSLAPRAASPPPHLDPSYTANNGCDEPQCLCSCHYPHGLTMEVSDARERRLKKVRDRGLVANPEYETTVECSFPSCGCLCHFVHLY